MSIFTIDMGGGKSSVMVYEDVSPTLTTTHYGEPAVCLDEEIVAIEGNGTRPSHLGGDLP